MDLVRDILLEVEENDNGRAMAYEFGEVELKKIHHINLLIQAGLLVRIDKSRSEHRAKVQLTWEGHDFVDAVRDKTIWEKTKSTAKNAGGWTLGTLLDIAKKHLTSEAADLLSSAS